MGFLEKLQSEDEAARNVPMVTDYLSARAIINAALRADGRERICLPQVWALSPSHRIFSR